MWFTCVTVMRVPIGGTILHEMLEPRAETTVGPVLTDQRIIGVPTDPGAAAEETPWMRSKTSGASTRRRPAAAA